MRRPATTAGPLIPPQPTLESLRAAAAACRACPLWKRGTQTVFGEGRAGARVLFVGEQPGNAEDLAGRPFVGPAGGLLARALDLAGIARADAYVTNTVKHFKWEPAGKRRIHKKPNALEIAACRPWLDAEIAVVEPEFIVCLGATAARALLGRSFRVSIERGRVIDRGGVGPKFLATVHPSSILRAPDDESRHAEFERFTADLRVLSRALGAAPSRRPAVSSGPRSRRNRGPSDRRRGAAGRVVR